LLVLAVLLGSAMPAFADGTTGVEVDAAVTVPLEGWGELTGLGLGGGVRLRVPVATDLEVTTRVGATWHLARTFERLGVQATRTLLQVPLTGGARFFASAPGRARLVLAGDVGLVIDRESVTAVGVTEADTSLRFAAALGAGVAAGRVTVMLSAWFADLAARDDHVGVGISVAGTITAPS